MSDQDGWGDNAGSSDGNYDSDNWDTWEGAAVQTPTDYSPREKDMAPITPSAGAGASPSVGPNLVVSSVTVLLCPVLAVTLGYSCYAKQAVASWCSAGYLYCTVYFLTLNFLHPPAPFAKSFSGMIRHLSMLHYYGLATLICLIWTSIGVTVYRLMLHLSLLNLASGLFVLLTLCVGFCTVVPYVHSVTESKRGSTEVGGNLLQRALVRFVTSSVGGGLHLRHSCGWLKMEIENSGLTEAYTGFSLQYPYAAKGAVGLVLVGWFAFVWILALHTQCHHTSEGAQIVCSIVSPVLLFVGTTTG